MMTFRSSDQLPRNLRGWSLWLQVYQDGRWHEVCALRAGDARALCRWLDRHPLCRAVQVLAVSTG